VQKRLSLLAAHARVCITEYKSNCGEKITLAGAIAADNNIVLRGERFNDGLFLVTIDASGFAVTHHSGLLPLEALNNNLFDMHVLRLAAPAGANDSVGAERSMARVGTEVKTANDASVLTKNCMLS
jgi:hypothetical protein